MKDVDYYFDFLSPYSYLSWHLSAAIRENHEIKINYRPVMMTSLFSHFEIKPPGEVAPKREFMLKQCFRISHKNNIPFQTPKTHPFNPLYALRLATVAASGRLQAKVIETLWKIGWTQGLDLGDPDVLEQELAKNEIPAKEIMENSFSPEAKNEIKNNIKLAKEQMAFGVPSWVIDGELFWGTDSLDDLQNTLNGKDYWDRQTYENALKNNPLLI